MPESTTHPQRRLCPPVSIVLMLVAVAGCAPDMADQPRYEPFEPSDFFADGMSSRPAVPGTVARGGLELDDHLYRGTVDGEPATTLPVEIELDEELLARGQQRFNIFCAQCHSRLGTGDGMVVRRGFPAPPSFHIDRLRGVPVGYLFDVISDGFGRMPAHGKMIPAADRWAIIAHVRTLQLSQYANTEVLDADDLQQIENDGP